MNWNVVLMKLGINICRVQLLAYVCIVNVGFSRGLYLK